MSRLGSRTDLFLSGHDAPSGSYAVSMVAKVKLRAVSLSRPRAFTRRPN
jgi:hypothetical protein